MKRRRNWNWYVKLKFKKVVLKKNLKIVMGFGLLLRRFKNQRTDEIFS